DHAPLLPRGTHDECPAIQVEISPPGPPYLAEPELGAEGDQEPETRVHLVGNVEDLPHLFERVPGPVRLRVGGLAGEYPPVGPELVAPAPGRDTRVRRNPLLVPEPLGNREDALHRDLGAAEALVSIG